MNTDHGDPSPPPLPRTPLSNRSPVQLGVFRFIFDTFGGYDYRMCDGQSNLLFGPFAAPPTASDLYASAIGFASIAYRTRGLVRTGRAAPPDVRGPRGHGVAGTSPAIGRPTPCWTGIIQLSTDLNADTPEIDDVPDPDCFKLE